MLNGASAYNHIIVNRKGDKPLADTLSDYNPLNVVTWAGGSILKGMADPESGTVKKIALGVAAVPVVPLVAITETAKALANPKQTFKNCARFIDYAWNTNSVALKACTVPVVAAAALVSAPALLQHGVQKLAVDPIRNSINAKKAAEVVANDPNKVPDVPDERIRKKQVVISVPEGTLKTRAAVQLQKDIMEAYPGALPVLSPRTADRASKLAEVSPTFREKRDRVRSALFQNVNIAVNPPLPLTPSLAVNGAPPKTSKDVKMEERYTQYCQNVTLAKNKFGESLNHEPVSFEQFQKHPNRMRKYGEQLKSDAKHNREPTNFATFLQQYETKKQSAPQASTVIPQNSPGKGVVPPLKLNQESQIEPIDLRQVPFYQKQFINSDLKSSTSVENAHPQTPRDSSPGNGPQRNSLLFSNGSQNRVSDKTATDIELKVSSEATNQHKPPKVK